jgi:UDP-N-acetylglucosamine 4,6-dehydratase
LNKPRDFGGDTFALDGCSILITGATGSFGRTMVRKLIAESRVARVAILSRDEFKQYQLEHELREAGHDMSRLRFFLGDVRDQSRLEMAMIGVDTVVHAAALKQVPAAEYNPFECIHTNGRRKRGAISNSSRRKKGPGFVHRQGFSSDQSIRSEQTCVR